jgi:trans-aconitate 2-methyltransferase
LSGTVRWNAADYAVNSRGQQAWALSTIDRIELGPSDAVLDVGCGDGKVTVELARRVPSGRVAGIDSSPDMVRLAMETWGESLPNVEFRVVDARALDFPPVFDWVFSNSALHWVPDHPAVLRGVARALKPGGRIMLSMGGRGTAAAVHRVLDDFRSGGTWAPHLADVVPPHHFFGPEEYGRWLPAAGLRVRRVELTGKEMRHAGIDALQGWLRTTWMPYLERIPSEAQAEFIAQLAEGVRNGCETNEDGAIVLPMVNLEVEAEKAGP